MRLVTAWAIPHLLQTSQHDDNAPLVIMTHDDPAVWPAGVVIRLDIRLWLTAAQSECPWGKGMSFATDVLPSIKRCRRPAHGSWLRRLRQGYYFHSDQHSLFIVMEDQRQDIDHLAINNARLAQHEVILQLLEAGGNSAKGRCSARRRVCAEGTAR
jgi:hypothetical protein